MIVRRLGSTPIAVGSVAAGGVFSAGSLSIARICRGLRRMFRLAWHTPWTASAAPATIGEADDVPLKNPVYEVVDPAAVGLVVELAVSTFSPQA